MKYNACYTDGSDTYENPQQPDTIVITGMSGNFAVADNTLQFYESLSNKVDLVVGDFGKLQNHPELPKRTGKINGLDKFDMGFFGITRRQSNSMDPAFRLLLGRVFEAIIDGGYSPSEFVNTNTGVFASCGILETERGVFYEELNHFSDAITGAQRSLMAKLVSYHFKLRGLSFQVDAACCGSLVALEHAYVAIREGKCDKAIVCGENLCLHPSISLELIRLGVASRDGKSKSFDNTVDGYARSEAVVVLLLERATDAKRVYAEVVHIKTCCDGYKIEGITFPNMEQKKQMTLDFYNECNIDRKTISFIEAHGTGTAVGDREELNFIDEVMCQNRKDPLYIGAVKSNLGHTEAASGICSIVKMILSMESGFILPNIHYYTPLKGVEGLEKGRLLVVTEKIPLSDQHELFATSNYGFGGTNAFALLRRNNKRKLCQKISNSILPQLICVSGRNKQGINKILDDFAKQEYDAEYAYLLNQAFSIPHENHIYRGFALYNKFGEIRRSYKRLELGDRKLVMIFDSFDQKWYRVGFQLLCIAIFARTFKRIQDILSNETRIDLFKVLDNSEKSSLSEQIVTAVAIQISLVDVLRAIGLNVYDTVGVEYGEIAAAYMKNTFSLDDTIHNLIHIIPDLNYSRPKYCNILKSLSANKDFCIGDNKEKQCSCFSSFYEKIMHNSDEFYLIIGSGSRINAKEILPLVDINAENYIESFLLSLGRLYEFGHNLEADKLYPTIQVPVSRATPMLSSLIEWDYSKNCKVYPFHVEARNCYLMETIQISMKSEKWNFILNHIIDGRNIFPASGYIVLILECLSKVLDKPIESLDIVFEDIEFLKEIIIPSDEFLELIIYVNTITKSFEITKGVDVIVKGKVYEQIEECLITELPRTKSDNKLCMDKDDIYTELRLRGYQYNNEFKGICKCNVDISQATIEWKNNWICCIDNILQMFLLHLNTKELHMAGGIERLILNIPEFLNQIEISNNSIAVELQKDIRIIRAPGVEIRGYHTKTIDKTNPEAAVLEVVKFVPNDTQLNTENSVRSIVQLILENVNGINIDIVEIYENGEEEQLLHALMTKAINEQPLIQHQVTVLINNIKEPLISLVQAKIKETRSNCLIVVATKLLEMQEELREVLQNNFKNIFLISREPLKCNLSEIKNISLNILCSYTTNNKTLILLKPKPNTFMKERTLSLCNALHNFQWIQRLRIMLQENNRVLLYTDNIEPSGILGLMCSLKKEYSTEKICCIFVMDDAPEFDPDSSFYRQQLDKKLSVNVWKNKQWGTYRHLLLPETKLVQRTNYCFDSIPFKAVPSLQWIESEPLEDEITFGGEDIITVYCAGLTSTATDIEQTGQIINKTDVTTSMSFGFSGKNSRGERVMGICLEGPLRTVIRTKFFLPIPDEWTMEDAASVISAYSPIIALLLTGCQFKSCETALIHHATDAIGLATVNICLHSGLIVFVTVQTEEQYNFIRDRYPKIHSDHISYIKNTSFASMIRKFTNGEGVNYVFDSDWGCDFSASLHCLARGGKFLHWGRNRLKGSYNLSLVEKEIEIIAVTIDKQFLEKSFHNYMEHVNRFISNKTMQCLPKITFNYKNIKQAINHIKEGNSIGKVLIRFINEENTNTVQSALSSSQEVIPRLYCNPNCSYVICGGLGGFGIELADFLVNRGAKKLILSSRSGITNGYQAYKIRLWERCGVTVVIKIDDASTKLGCIALLKAACYLGPIDGIFNLAAVLRDGIFENQTEKTFKDALVPKTYTTQNLDIISRQLCPNLRYFVVFSSFAAGRGILGQTNYAMANSITDRICEKRKDEGYPALAIQWAAVREVGIVARLQSGRSEVIDGTIPQRICSCLQQLDKFLFQNEPIVASMVVAPKNYSSKNDLFQDIINILGIRNIGSISMQSTLPEIGLDSITLVEIKQILERKYDMFMESDEIRGLTLANVKTMN